MKNYNWYTITLFTTAIVGLAMSIYNFRVVNLPLFLIILFFLAFIDANPIQLPSGDLYQFSSLMVVLLAFTFDVYHSVFAIFVGTFAFFLREKGFKINYFRYFVSCGMYIYCLMLVESSLFFTESLPLVLRVFIAVTVFEVFNIVFLEMILKTVMGIRMFEKWRLYAKEIIVPIIVGTVIISYLLTIQADDNLIITLLYTVFFIFVLLFFSKEFTKQLSLRQSATRSFIQLLESRITSNLAGHGNRVGRICELLLDDFAYPKKKRNDLVQAATIHDIGKALLAPYIFRKRGDLTLSEEREYKSHPEKAVDIVKTMFPKENFSNWILHHHERYDGKGFPSGLKGEDIPLESRIITLCNEIDHAMRQNEDVMTVLGLIQNKAGKLLDPQLVAKLDADTLSYIREELDAFPKEEEHDLTLVQEEQAFVDEAKEQIGKAYFLQVQNGAIQDNPLPHLQNVLLEVADQAKKRQQSVHESTNYADQYYDIHAYPLMANGETLLFVQDTSATIHYRKELERNILESYEEVITTLSEEKVRFYANLPDVEVLLGDYQAEMAITAAKDIPVSRKFMDMFIQEQELDVKPMMVQWAVSEATTNLLKHAKGGKLTVYRTTDALQIVVSDQGSGIPLHEIPKTILVSGYSSKRSLGKGFHMMTNFASRVSVHTSSNGTFILLEFKSKEEIDEKPSGLPVS